MPDSMEFHYQIVVTYQKKLQVRIRNVILFAVTKMLTVMVSNVNECCLIYMANLLV